MAVLSRSILVLALCIAYAHLLPLELTGETWNSNLGTGTTFVKFYAPWCGHCKKLAPTWDELSEVESLQSKGITVAKLDCTKNEELCHRNGVTGFPTLKLFKDSKTFTYEGDRSKASLIDFALNPKASPANDQKQPIKWSEDNGIVDLDATNFDQVRNGVWLLAFYADWCGSCQKMSKEYEKVAVQLKDEVRVAKANIDGTGSSLAAVFNVSRVPTIVLFRDGKVYNMEYLSQSADKFVQFIRDGYKFQESQSIPVLQRRQESPPPSSTPQPRRDTSVPTVAVDPLSTFLAKVNKLKAADFAQDEALMGAIAGLIMFLFGFLLGRVTAPSPAPVKSDANKKKQQ